MDKKKTLKYWQFLVPVFRHLKNAKPRCVGFAELNLYSDYLKRTFNIEVDPSTDDYAHTFTFYENVFTEVFLDGEKKSAYGVSCNYGSLKMFGDEIMRNGDYTPELWKIRFKDKEIYNAH